MKRVLEKIERFVTILVTIIAVCMMIFTVVSVTTFDRNDRDLFGYKAFIVLSDSMSDTFQAGDVVLVKEVDTSTLQVGDIISYQSQSTDNYGEVITHKIREITDEGFITYGTTTNTDDEEVVSSDNVLGKYEHRVPKVGSFFQFLKTTPGYMICIFVPFVTLILYNGINTIQLFRRYKKEQMEEIELARKQLEEERKESLRMVEEIKALKEQLELSQK